MTEIGGSKSCMWDEGGSDDDRANGCQKALSRSLLLAEPKRKEV